jgi:hypothetical protein
MKLILTQPEIEQIVRDHVLNTVQLRSGAELQIEFSATRGEAGITATIEIPYIGVSAIPEISRAAETSTGSGKPISATMGGVLSGQATTKDLPKTTLFNTTDKVNEPTTATAGDVTEDASKAETAVQAPAASPTPRKRGVTTVAGPAPIAPTEVAQPAADASAAPDAAPFADAEATDAAAAAGDEAAVPEPAPPAVPRKSLFS